MKQGVYDIFWRKVYKSFMAVKIFWDNLPEICSSILWHENVIGGLRNLFMYSRRAMKFSTRYRGIMTFLPSWNISNCPSPQYLLTTLLPNRISSIVYTQNKGRRGGVLSLQLCGVYTCFSIGYCLVNNYIYHMTKCNLLLVVCRSWNHNIDAGFVYYKSLNVTYGLSIDTWICIYLVVNKQISFYLAALTNKINTFYLHYCIQYAILIVFLFFLIW